MRYLLAIVLIVGGVPTITQADHAVNLERLHEGSWALVFVILPGCPACDDVIVWLGRAANAYPDLNVLLLCPWLTDELEAAAAEAKWPLAVDAGGLLGAGLGVKRAPTVVFSLDRRPLAWLNWPFREDDLVRRIRELAAAPRGGPWQHLGAAASLGTVATLDGESVDLDHIPGPWLLSFFSPRCPACQEELPMLVQLSQEIEVVLAVMASHALSVRDREMLRQAGVGAVADDDEALARMLAVRVTPTHVLMDREGRISCVQEEVLKQEELRTAILVTPGGDAEDRSEQEGGS
jgi:thiol-disulfide isomerase/thioredoxin